MLPSLDAPGPNGAPPAVQKPPLPKNPARLMALALAESANRAEGALLPYRPPQTGYRPPPHPGYSHQVGAPLHETGDPPSGGTVCVYTQDLSPKASDTTHCVDVCFVKRQ